MKRLRLESITAWILLGILGVIVIHAPLTVFVSTHWPEATDSIKAWKEILLSIALVLLVIDYSRAHQWRKLLHDRLLWCIAAFALLHVGVALCSQTGLSAILAGLMIDLRFIAYFTAVYVFLLRYPRYTTTFFTVGCVGFCVVTGVAVLQLFLPHDVLKYLGYGDATIQPYLTVDKNPAFIRENSTLRGPNPLGAYAMMVLVTVVAFGVSAPRAFLAQSKHRRYLVVGLAIAAIVSLWVSYSRSAWIGAVVAVAIIIGVRWGRHLSRRLMLIGVACAIVLMGLLFAARQTYFVKNVLIHDNPTTGATIDSNAGHLSSLQRGISAVVAHPFGAGIGSTGSASLLTSHAIVIENQFLFVAHEVGWLGFGLFVTILGIVFTRLWRKRQDWRALAACASGIGLVVIGLMLPVWVDDTVSMVWWGLAAVVLAGKPMKGEWYGTTSDEETTRIA